MPKRSDRLMHLMTRLRDGTLLRAEDLADELSVTERTIYRDMDALRRSGLPVEGTRGAGYRITAEITLPPLNLTIEELEALHLGLAAVAQSGDADLQNIAEGLAEKLDAALPEDGPNNPAGMGLSVHPFSATGSGTIHQAALRQAIRARQKLSLRIGTEPRIIRPLRLDYWGRFWSIVVWCETHNGFDEIRLDQIQELTPLPHLFVPETGKQLSDFERQAT
ncbi:helix-turn-helix transcriptional regulator [Aestuariibius sp. HNIBRBA575]|uniref:helix-turn-helix transcriptional regulator n=1 Tax=Aestuariibius sp. HNIBRBA575 TaxID=3233343 RepID=UPI0034A4E281